MKQSMRLDGARARSARQASRLTREALASRTGVSVSTLQRAERGDPIQSDIIELIADALGVGMEDLLPVSPGPKSLLKPGSELIERDAEWSTLQGALARARAGDLSLLLVSGEAGMGKTALLRQLYAESRSLGIRLLLGEGSQFEGSRFAFDPFVLAMREHLAAIEQVLHGDELAVLRAFLDRSDESGSEARRARLFDAVSSALRELGRRHCIVFAIDDLQWVDRDSLELFELLARRLLAVSAQSDAPCGILMIASTRPFDNRGKLVGEHDDVSENVVGTLRSVLERLDRLPLLQRVPLEGLSPRGVRTLIKQLGIERPAVQLVDTIHRGATARCCAPLWPRTWAPMRTRSVRPAARIGRRVSPHPRPAGKDAGQPQVHVPRCTCQ